MLKLLKIHIDLIKGKVNDENYKNVMCYYNDNDLKDRWDKLMSIKLDDEKFEYLPYFDIDNMDKSINNNKPEKIKDEKIRIEIAKSFLTYITKAIMIDKEKGLLNLPHFEPEPSPDGSINDDYEYQGEI